MATAEIVRDSPASTTERAIALATDVVQGSTQEFQATAWQSSSPLFYAPSESRTDQKGYWASLARKLRSFYALIAPAPSVTPIWDRLTFDLMRMQSLPEDWDGEGAEVISPAAVRTAADLLQLARAIAERSRLADDGVPALTPSVEGGVVLTWIHGHKELKCSIFGETVEVVRWKSTDAYESDGLWEVPVLGVWEHFDWLLK